MQQTEKIDWLSVLRGMTIVLVVMNHVRLLDVSTGECYSFVFGINRWFAPLRMPTFIMVSGALLYYSRITRGWATLPLYKDKLARLGMPLLFCTVLGNVMQLIFNAFVKHPLEVTPTSFLQSFVLCDGMPWPHRWYLMTLLTIMALYPLFVLRKSKLADCIILLALFVLMDFDFGRYAESDWFCLFSLNRYIPYFYLGIVAFKYRWYTYLESWKVAVSLLLAYFILYLFEVVPVPSFITDHAPFFELLGMCTIVSVAMNIAKVFPHAFKSFSGYIFQIYLFGIAFQAFVELILWRSAGCPDALVTPFYILNVLAGIWLPALMSKLIERIPVKAIRLCFGLK